MKKLDSLHREIRTILLLTAFFAAIMPALSAQSVRPFDITSRFKLWLLNNEARAMSSLKSDEMLISRVSAPFAFMPFESAAVAQAEERIWAIHHKIYALVDELQEIYSFAKHYGNGRFSILFKQHRPEIWSVLPLQVALPGLISVIAVDYRKAFHADLLKSLQLDASRDLDLSGRLQRAVKKLSDEEYRLFNDYLGTFSALFPSDPTARIISAFIESGSKKQFAAGLKDFLQPVFTAPVFSDINISAAPVEPDDPLAELEKLADMSAGSTTPKTAPEATVDADDSDIPAQPATLQELEPPPPGSEDLFKIWD
ncbi:MAG TPA: hypothetical protein DCG57_17685 [Candidatus Riflebacteria bacterium]|nr:hypothetical protein [Candidatus Riflebacteria bacterium]